MPEQMMTLQWNVCKLKDSQTMIVCMFPPITTVWAVCWSESGKKLQPAEGGWVSVACSLWTVDPAPNHDSCSIQGSVRRAAGVGGLGRERCGWLVFRKVASLPLCWFLSPALFWQGRFQWTKRLYTREEVDKTTWRLRKWQGWHKILTKVCLSCIVTVWSFG